MKEIPRSMLDGLTEELNAFSAAGQQMVLNALAKAEWSDVAELRAVMAEAMETVCGEMTDMAAARTAEFYDSVRAAAVGASFGAIAASAREPAATEAAVRALVQSVVDTGSTERFTRQLTDRVDYEIKKASGDCIDFNADRDPLKPGYARVPRGAETCSYCFLMSSYGFAYKTVRAAGGGGNHYHPNCDCRIVPGFDAQSIEGYDPDGMYERTGACLETLGGRDGVISDWDALPENKREDYIKRHGGRPGKAFDAYLTKRLTREISTRDPKWLYDGTAPDITFETPELEEEIKAKRPHEIRTAHRLKKHGISPDFQVDEKAILDSGTGRRQKVGLPDFSSGYEIKTLQGTASENTINGYLKNTSKKQGAVAVVFDNSDNSKLSDKELAKMLAKLRSFSKGRIYMIGKDGSYIHIKRGAAHTTKG